MKILIGIIVLALVNTPLVSAYSTSRPYYSPYRYNYTQPNRSTAPRTSSPQSSRVGTGQLRSRTAAPAPHDYNGVKYNSSTAKYTNTSGLWVFWWLMFVTADGQKELRCFDEKHNRVTCNRDDKAYQKDW